ncbi:MAG: DUF4249 family protein [Candidatus Glassbacteria bacterium]|nr:DUF4249 family protein [Candidatus Glassbacteria bacterium]
MIKTKTLLYMAGCIALLTGCQGAKLLPPSNELVVVRGYLQANIPVSNLNITSTLDLGSPDTAGPPIRDAMVNVITNDVCYELFHMGNGNYGSPENPYGTDDCLECGFNLFPGDTIYLEVFYFGKIATASTVIPPKPENLQKPVDPLIVPASANGEPHGDALEISWELDGDFWFYIESWNYEVNRVPIDGGEPVSGYEPHYISDLFMDRKFVVAWDQLPYYGRYRIKVVVATREYVELYLTRNQDSRDLNEPISNITNGLGIFTATNNVSFDITVER